MQTAQIQPVRDEFVIADDTTIHVIQWGKQDKKGPPIVCVHGLSANAFFFQIIADNFAQDHRVFAYDLRGRGDSDKPEEGYSVPIHAADLAALLDELQIEAPILVGHSLGALISLYFAAHYPDKLSKLVLLDAGAPLPWQTPEEQPAWLTASINRLGTTIPSFETYVTALKAVPFLEPYWNSYTDAYFQHDVIHNNDGSVASKCSREAVLEEGMRFAEAEPEQQWSHVTVPTLLLRAGQGLFSDNDQLLPEESAERIQQGIAQCKYVNYPALNHYTIVLNADQGPLQEIRAFIEEK
jgi:pimeloyl-ACP methyl ester carboxylesterase